MGLSVDSGHPSDRQPPVQRGHAVPHSAAGLDAQQEQPLRLRTRPGRVDFPTRGRASNDGRPDGPRALQIVGHVPELRKRGVSLHIAW